MNPRQLTSLRGVHLWESHGILMLCDALGNPLLPPVRDLGTAVRQFIDRVTLRTVDDLRALEACIKGICEVLAKPQEMQGQQSQTHFSLSPITAKVRMGSASYRREVYRLSAAEGTCVLMGATRRCQLQSDGTWMVV
jgi:hypothetical protein